MGSANSYPALPDVEYVKWHPRNVDLCALASGALVPIVHTLCGIPVLHGQFCVQLAMDDSSAAGYRELCYVGLAESFLSVVLDALLTN